MHQGVPFLRRAPQGSRMHGARHTYAISVQALEATSHLDVLALYALKQQRYQLLNQERFTCNGGLPRLSCVPWLIAGSGHVVRMGGTISSLRSVVPPLYWPHWGFFD